MFVVFGIVVFIVVVVIAAVVIVIAVVVIVVRAADGAFDVDVDAVVTRGSQRYKG